MGEYQIFQQNIGEPLPPPPPPGMTAPPPPPSTGMQQGGSASTLAIMALVVGIVSYVFCPFIAGIAAWIMGKMELNKIERGESSDAGSSMAKIGMWLGIVNVILSILAIIFYVLMLVFAIATASRG